MNMLVAITGTPGVGKTAVSSILLQREYEVVELNEKAKDGDFVAGIDKKRDSKIIDVDRLNKFVEETYKGQNLVFIEGHLSHLLKCMDKIIVLRCHPKELKKRLKNKNWREEKNKENIESEILDIILCEAIDIHSKENIFEIDTTKKSVDDTATSIIEIKENNFEHMKKYNMGNIDWSNEILKDF